MVRIKWNQKAFQEIRTKPEVMEELNRIAGDIASRAGEGYVAEPAKPTGGRVRGRSAVVTGNIAAMLDERRNHTLEGVL